MNAYPLTRGLINVYPLKVGNKLCNCNSPIGDFKSPIGVLKTTCKLVIIKIDLAQALGHKGGRLRARALDRVGEGRGTSLSYQEENKKKYQEKEGLGLEPTQPKSG